MDRGAGRRMNEVRREERRLYSEIESYIKRDGGREKIRAWEREVLRRALKKKGNIK